MTTRPTGTVMFLFTDIEGSTRLLQQLGASHDASFGAHHTLPLAIERSAAQVGKILDTGIAVRLDHMFVYVGH